MKIFISYCGADQAIKDEIATLIEAERDNFAESVEIISMDTHCAGNWAEWMIGAVKSCDIMISILTKSSMYVADGDGKKRVFEEARVARDNDKEIIPYATCKIPDEMLAHIGSFSITDTIVGAVEKARVLVSAIARGEKLDLRESASLSGFRPAQTNKNFVGREAEISWLDETLRNHNVVILKGEGGIGKTTLAEYFFQSHKDKYTGAYIVDASTGVRTCITNMPFKTSHIQDDDERYTENKKYLSRLDEKTIIILDNCDVVIDGEELDDIIDKTKCRFIITSRKGDDGRCVVESYNVGRMDNSDLLALVRRYNPDIEEQNGLTREQTDKKLIELFKLVDGHTLTIEMASAIMESAWVSIDEIMESLLECEETAKTRKFKGEETIMANLGALYDFARLTDEEKRVLNLLCLVCPSVGIELASVKKMLEFKTVAPIKSLVNGTFARRDEHSRLSMHPLFADVYYKKEEPYSTPEAKMVIDYIMDTDFNQIDTETAKRQIALMEYILEKRPQIYDKDARDGMEILLISAYFILGKFHESERILDDRIAEIEKMSEDEQIENEAWNEYNFITSVCMKIGDYERGLDCAYKSRNLLDIVCGDEYIMPENAQANNNLGCIYREIGDFQSACDCFESAKDEYEALLDIEQDDEERETLQSLLVTVYTNLGVSYIEIGRAKEAFEFSTRAIDAYHEFYGEGGDSRLALCYNNLGNIYTRTGDHENALDCMTRAIELMEASCGDDPHPDLALMYNNRGQEHLILGDMESGRAWIERARDMLEQIYQDEPNPLFATIYNNLAEIHRASGENDLALEFYKKAYSVAEIVYADYPEHPLLATLNSNMGLLYEAQGDLDSAIKSVINAIVIFEAISESVPADEQLMAVYNQARLICYKAKIYESAVEYLEKLIEVHKRSSQVEQRVDEALARYYYDLAFYYRLMGKFDEVVRCARPSASIFYTINKEVRPCKEMVARLSEELGWAYKNLKDYENQRLWYKTSNDFYFLAHEKSDTADYLRTCFYLADSLFWLGKDEEAIEKFKEAEELHEKMGVRSFIKSVYGGLTALYKKQGSTEMAELYARKLEEARNGN